MPSVLPSQNSQPAGWDISSVSLTSPVLLPAGRFNSCEASTAGSRALASSAISWLAAVPWSRVAAVPSAVPSRQGRNCDPVHEPMSTQPELAGLRILSLLATVSHHSMNG